jgi:2'-5' RNA ligase
MRDLIGPAVSSVEGDTVYRGNWHVTLVFIGDVAEERLAELMYAAEQVRAEPFRIRFDRLDFWPRLKIACLTASSVPPQLDSLVSALERELEPVGVASEARVYRPHITVARRARAFAAEPLARSLTLEWSAFELMESVSGSRDVRYRPLKQWLLSDS